MCNYIFYTLLKRFSICVEHSFNPILLVVVDLSSLSREVDEILTGGAGILYKKYLERRAFPFAARATTELLLAELSMAFVRAAVGFQILCQSVRRISPDL